MFIGGSSFHVWGHFCHRSVPGLLRFLALCGVILIADPHIVGQDLSKEQRQCEC